MSFPGHIPSRPRGRTWVLDPDGLFAQRFIGRETELEDYQVALDGLMVRFQRTREGARPSKAQRTRKGARPSKVQLIWLHGFGGMGKSWFLRRAAVQTRSDSPTVKVALVDWYRSDWCKPASTPPTEARDVFQAIAHRIAQLYGAEHLDPYWEARQRVNAQWDDVVSLYWRLDDVLDHIQTHGPAWSNNVESSGEQGFLSGTRRIPRSELSFTERLMREHGFWSDDPAKLERHIGTLRQHIPRYDLPDPGADHGFFDAWLVHVAGKKWDVLARPCGLLADALQGCMRRVCAEAPLVLMLDTCEMLTPVLDGWLRRLLVGLLDGSTPLLALIGSRSRPDHYIGAGEKIGWRNAVESVRFRSIAFDEERRFSLIQISQALAAAGLDLSEKEELPGLVHRVTLGVPLALGVLLELHVDGAPVLEELSSLDLGAADALDQTQGMEEVTREVAGRFLLHLENKPAAAEDLRDITALALLRHASAEVLCSFWDTLDARPRLRELSLRYSLLANGDLHETVREYLRRRWRKQTSQAVMDVAATLSAAVDQTRPDTPPGSKERTEWELERLNLMSWRQGANAYPEFARMLAVFLAYGNGVSELLELARDIEPHSARDGEIRKMWDPRLWRPWRRQSLQAVEWLQKQVNPSWNAHDRACLALYRGLCLGQKQRSAEAVEHFEAAFQVFGCEVPRPDDVGKVYLRAVENLGQSKPKAASRAADFARQLGLADEEQWSDDYYSVLHNSQRYAEAERYCRRCMEADPEAISPRIFLAHVLAKHLQRTTEAERLLREGLEVDQDDVNLHLFLADILETQLGRAEEAEAEYRVALTQLSDSESASVLARLGRFLGHRPGRQSEATKLLRKALRLTPKNDPDICCEVAWCLYQAGIDLREAEELARAALAGAPGSLYILRTLTAILVQQGKWSDARFQLEAWTQASEVPYLRSDWDDVVYMLRDALKLGHGAEVAAIVGGRTDHPAWNVLGAALRAATLGSRDFSHLPEALRSPAETLLQQLLSKTGHAVFPDLPESIP
jgi:tetratricopeptide (TPR) repeat protein